MSSALEVRAKAEIELRRRRRERGGDGTPAPADWAPWLRRILPAWFSDFAPHHEDFWDWLWAITPEEPAEPFVGIWSRGHGKSTSAEGGTVALGLREVRRYALYVCGTQDAADKRVTNVGRLLDSDTIERYYPKHAQRGVNRYGHSIGWRRDRLVTSGGFVVDAAGLDTAVRGLKFEAQRPDLIILDDLDSLHDTPAATAKKIETITHSILPAAAPGAVVLAIQNLIVPHGIFAQLSDGRADFLADRLLSGPHPAVRDLTTEVRADAEGRIRVHVTGGRPTWRSRGLEWAQEEIAKVGLRSFLREHQHEVKQREGALWKLTDIRHRADRPRMQRIVVGVDPSGGGTETGIVAAGLGFDGRGYLLADRTQKGVLGPLNWGRVSVDLYDELDADLIAAERNFGGDMVEANIRVAAGKRRVPVKLVSASRGKDVRAEPVAALYADGLIDHCGHFPELEAEMTGWRPGDKESPNRLDACFVAGTLIRTARGEVPIEGIAVGDLAWTRAGWKPVLNCGQTNRSAEVCTLHLTNGATITGTPSHPVWVHGRGWVELDALVCGDILETCQAASRVSASKALSTSAFRNRLAAREVSILAHLAEAARKCCTGRYGRRRTAPFPMARTFTTATATRSTTLSRIWNAWIAVRTQIGMPASTLRPGERGPNRFAIWLLSGTAHPRAERGTQSTASGPGRAASRSRSFAATAGSRRSASRPPAIAAEPAPEPRQTPNGDTSGRLPAPPAATSSGRISTKLAPPHALVSVLGLSESGRAPVYNLEVAEQPEYFANGVLVHNCVWAFTELMLTELVQQDPLLSHSYPTI